MPFYLFRDVLGWKDANSTEIDEQTGYPVVIYMPEVSKSGERES